MADRPVFFSSTLLSDTAAAIYTVPSDKVLHDAVIKLTNTSGAGVAVTVYCVQDPTVVRASGTHDGSGNSATLSDSTASWTTNQWIGYKVLNTTDGSEGIITANTATTITATLAGGSENDWDASDAYQIKHAPSILNEQFPGTTVAADDYEIFTVERAPASSVIYALAATASVVTIQSLSGKLV